MPCSSAGISCVKCKQKPTGMFNPKLKEYIVADFLSLKEDDQNLKGLRCMLFLCGCK
jgi:hypothetical protein